MSPSNYILLRENEILRHCVQKLFDNMDEQWGRDYRDIDQFKEIIEELKSWGAFD